MFGTIEQLLIDEDFKIFNFVKLPGKLLSAVCKYVHRVKPSTPNSKARLKL